MTKYTNVKLDLRNNPKIWLITGVAGFIGSNLLEALLKLDQKVFGLDNFCTGFQHNLDEVKNNLSNHQWSNFTFYEGDIRNLADCKRACTGIDFILHQAALGSVPRSMADPISTNMSNIDGFLNMLVAAKESAVSNFVYAASSSTYGDHPALPKIESTIGRPLSPYAVTKYVNELYADVFFRCYSLNTIGLRYFNVFGPRQNPAGAYAAVIPKWISSMIKSENIIINGDGTTSRDFTYIENVIQANIMAATCCEIKSLNQVYNIAASYQTSLNELFDIISNKLYSINSNFKISKKEYQKFRDGDVLHSLASINKAKDLIGYEPSHDILSGIHETCLWHLNK